MKHERTLSLLLGTLTATMLSFGGGMCLATGFVMDWSWPILLVFCLGFSLLAAFAAGTRWGSLLLAGAAVLGGFLLRKLWLPSLEVLLNHITTFYHLGYGFPMVQWSEELPEAGMMPALCLIAIPTVLGVCRTVCRRKSAIWGLVPGLLSLGACLVVTDSVPHSLAIFLVITGFLLLVLPQTVRRRRPGDGLRLTALLLIPCCLFSGILFWAIPKNGYHDPAQEIQQALVDWFWSLPFMPERPQGPGIAPMPGPVPGLTSSLSDLGPRTESYSPVLQVTAPRTEILYLRGQAYEVYDGLNWIAPDEELEDSGWPSASVTPVGPVKIQSMGFPPILYFPYYISKQQLQTGMDRGALTNKDYTLSYSFQLLDATGGATLSPALRERCLGLPSATEDSLRAFLAEQVLTVPADRLTQAQIVEHIERFVSQTATYDLNTQPMPEGSGDFALWFLTLGTSGYCVHYATAATVLLRAAGIPARYVTGYAATVYENTPTTVLAKEAHAWVEYFQEGVGWVTLDATPPEGRPEPPQEQPPVVTDPTEPSTEAPTDPSTEPEDTTAPTQNTTRPNRPDRPTEAPTTPGTTASPEPPGPRAQWLLPVLLALAAAAGLVGLVWGQYALRCRLRRKWLRKKAPNRQALALWRRTRRYSRLLKQRPPARLRALTDKAVFSQHTLTDGELREYSRWLRHADQLLKKKPLYWLKKLFWALDN